MTGLKIESVSVYDAEGNTYDMEPTVTGIKRELCKISDSKQESTYTARLPLLITNYVGYYILSTPTQAPTKTQPSMHIRTLETSFFQTKRGARR